MTNTKNSESSAHTRKSSRPTRDRIYPLEYSLDMVNFDIWNYMFHIQCYKSLTMTTFTEPPRMILDIGCGGGYWCIEAAKKWPNSYFFGLDILEIQPSLNVLESHHNIVDRIQWIHTDVLKGLPFPRDQFDFIRIVNLGLAIPEDEWPFLLQEIERVMKPGAVLEIVEDDLIFPCGPPPKNTSPDLTLRPNSGRYSGNSVESRTPTSSEERVAPQELNMWPLVEEEAAVDDVFDPTIPNLPPTFISHHQNRQNHSKLKSAWESMLSSRFLAQHITMILPLYLTATFSKVQSHPQLRIPLPPNSKTRSSREKTSPSGPILPLSSKVSAEDDQMDQKSWSCWAPMSLARTVETVRACKEAIYVEYERLFGDEDSAIPRISSRTTSKASKDGNMFLRSSSSQRDTFEYEFSNWEHDMADRTALRDRVSSSCQWNEPVGSSFPSWQIWRNSLGDVHHGYPKGTDADDFDVCRSCRGFIMSKAEAPAV